MTGLSILAALLLDRMLGEARHGHPLVFFGAAAKRIESVCDRSRVQGAVAWCVLVLVPTGLLASLQSHLGGPAVALLGVIVLYFCLGMRSLEEHARAVAAPLVSGDVPLARQQVSRIVSRDTAQLDASAVVRATVESTLENGSDAVLAPVFWFAVAGAPGVLGYRLANTLDAMWGYRDARYRAFGFAAARIDDVLNWVPSRLCAMAYALVGSSRAAWQSWQTQAPMYDSPNAGPVMAAGAGALGVRLGGVVRYGDQLRWRPALGEGRAAQPVDIERALQLLRRAIAVWLVIILAWGFLTWD
ncbi:MAG: cobalamin biosynthesis protein [Halioglobus sp.]|nr:cobalamin biosynthesis protein [Halioglobus sp.]